MKSESYKGLDTEKNTKLGSVYSYFRDHGEEIKLWQDTEDTEQLNPVGRLRSIESVWKSCQQFLNDPKTAIDLGSGFAYGLVYMETIGIKVVGIESVKHKIDQAVNLFEKSPIPLKKSESINLQETPAIVHGDVMDVDIREEDKVDLVTAFYLSGEMVNNPLFLSKAKSFLKNGGKILLSTQVSNEEVTEWLNRNQIKDKQVQVIDVPNNFEGTAILLSL